MKEELRVALVQTSLFWEDPEKNRIAFSEKLKEIPSNTDIIVLPEMFISGFTMSPAKMSEEEGPRTLEWMQKVATEKNMALVGSMPYQENGTYSNRLFFVQANGNYAQYDKRHTFTLAGEDKVYVAGRERLVVDYKGFRICPLICYDLRFPVWARNTVDYDVLLYVANWPTPRVEAWDTLLKARAIENMSYCIGVNRIGADDLGHQYSGHSAVYDCLGTQLIFSQKEEICYATLSKAHVKKTREKLRFLEDRDTFTLGG
ncbi:MAG: nitrilase family protein [Maribacter sp.]|uniref:amidohydrolase n=1 Tax=Maribacter sp. 2307UL18-2 TaxID=3386274 RepID=UPI0039BCF5D4